MYSFPAYGLMSEEWVPQYKVDPVPFVVSLSNHERRQA